MTIDIKIAVKPVIKKYLGTTVKIDPMILSRTNIYGMFLYNCLFKVALTKNLKGEKLQEILQGINTRKYPEVLKITISEDMWRRKGWCILPQHQADFNRLVGKLLDNEFHYFMDIQTQVMKKQIYSSLLLFRKKFDFTEEDMPIKTMEKNYERYRRGLTNSYSTENN